jgi:hypothetical protein
MKKNKFLRDETGKKSETPFRVGEGGKEGWRVKSKLRALASNPE